MKDLLFILFVLILILTVLALIHLLILAWSVGLGWILSQISILELSLFEGALLGIISTGITIMFIHQVISGTRRGRSHNNDNDNDDGFEDDFHDWLNRDFEIPPTRFYKKASDKTWEAWIRYVMANNIYQALEDAPYSIVKMGEKQLQELAIRLGNISVDVIKTKGNSTHSLKMSVTALKKQMKKMKQRPYDADILALAVEAINKELEYEETTDVIEDALWDEPCDLFE